MNSIPTLIIAPVVAVSFLYISNNLTLCSAILSILISASLSYFINGVFDKCRLPPSPTNLDLLKILHNIIRFGMDECLMRLYQIYGGIITLNAPYVKIIIINDYEAIKEFSQNPHFLGRPQTGVVQDLLGGNGVLGSEGALWKHQKRFLIQAMKESSINSMHVEETIVDELEKLCKEIDKQLEAPTVLDLMFQKMTCNVMFGLAFKKRYEYDDPKLKFRIEKFQESLKISGSLILVALFSFARPFIQKSLDVIKKNTMLFDYFADELIEEHKQNLNLDSPDKDLVNMYLKILAEKESDPESSEKLDTFSECQLKKIIIDLFMSGSETSSSTIKWAILLMINNPEIQERVHREIVDVVGTERMPSYSDRFNLPYTMATLQEVERVATVLPRGVPRSNPKEATFRQYSFPARTFFIMNIHAVHYDPKLWDRPEQFNPSRFLNSDGKLFRPPYLIPFGTGKRMCSGEVLALMEIFFLFTVLMQRYSFQSLDGKPQKLKVTSGVVRAPIITDYIIKAR